MQKTLFGFFFGLWLSFSFFLQIFSSSSSLLYQDKDYFMVQGLKNQVNHHSYLLFHLKNSATFSFSRCFYTSSSLPLGKTSSVKRSSKPISYIHTNLSFIRHNYQYRGRNSLFYFRKGDSSGNQNKLTSYRVKEKKSLINCPFDFSRRLPLFLTFATAKNQENSNMNLEKKIEFAVRALYNASSASSTTRKDTATTSSSSSLVTVHRDYENQLCLANAGVGGSLNQWLLSTPGASSTVLDIQVPYSKEALLEYLELNARNHAQHERIVNLHRDKKALKSFKFVSAEVSEALANAALDRAINLQIGEKGLGVLREEYRRWLGLAVTASVVSNYPHRGKHRAFISLSERHLKSFQETAPYQDNEKETLTNTDTMKDNVKDQIPRKPKIDEEENTFTYYIELEKGKRNRAQEDEVVSRVTLAVLLHHTVDFNYIKNKSQKNIPQESSDATSWFEYLELGNVVKIESTEFNSTFNHSLKEDTVHQVFDTNKKQMGVGSPSYPDLLQEGQAKHIVLVPQTFSNLASDDNHNDNASKDNNLQISAFLDLPIPPGSFIYPGSFNPLHVGHMGLIEAAMAKVKSQLLSSASCDPPVLESSTASNTTTATINSLSDTQTSTSVLEIAIFNADKGAISMEEIEMRLHQIWSFNPSQIVALTSFPLFAQKVASFPGCYFIVGTDTLERILDPKYYDNSVDKMISALRSLSEKQVKFIVGGRKKQVEVHRRGSGASEEKTEVNQKSTLKGQVVETFITLESIIDSREFGDSNNEGGKGTLDLPADIIEMFIGLTEDEFRLDLSSTELRRRKKEDQEGGIRNELEKGKDNTP